MANVVQLHDAPRCKAGLPEFPKFICRTVKVAEKRGGKWKAMWLCRCGVEFEAYVINVTRRHTKSCGCDLGETGRAATHGHFVGDKPTPTYKSWQAMIARCTNPKHPQFKHYGGRGIVICPEWRHSFPSFLSDVGERPTGKTLDRINCDGNYEPSNCRWATIAEQNRNRRLKQKQ